MSCLKIWRAVEVFFLTGAASSCYAAPASSWGPWSTPQRPPSGFVTVSDNTFQLDGKDFYYAGSNAYYLPYNNNQTDVELGLGAAKAAGLKVMRVWGFNDKNATYDPEGLPEYGNTTTEVVFQNFQGGSSVIDISPYDKVVNAASKTGMKLIVTLTNNWADYGGMDVYTLNLGGQYHDDVSVSGREPPHS
jgi:mannan endo-1,4-beta-mannosidase